jgi:hypothetical protein
VEITEGRRSLPSYQNSGCKKAPETNDVWLGSTLNVPPSAKRNDTERGTLPKKISTPGRTVTLFSFFHRQTDYLVLCTSLTSVEKPGRGESLVLDRDGGRVVSHEAN